MIMSTAAPPPDALACAAPPAAPPPEILARVLAVATAAARDAGALILAARGGAAVDAEKSGFQDLVTVTDTACERAIVARVKESFPGHAILAEESVAPGRAAAAAAVAAVAGAEWCWVIDPIDGTTNFVCGIPLSVVSIGVAFHGRVVAAVVFEPFRDELFAAARGGGATLNGAPLRVARAPLRACVLGFGTHNSPRIGHAMLRAAAPFVDAARGLRALGSAAAALAYVAAGRLGGYFEQDLSAWDVAAGALLIEEAGGRVTDMRGGGFSLATRDILGTCGGDAHDEALALLAGAKANSSDETHAAADAAARA